jgi:hypothetical protein
MQHILLSLSYGVKIGDTVMITAIFPEFFIFITTPLLILKLLETAGTYARTYRQK